MYFALVLAIVGLAGRPASKSRENAPGYVFALSTLALAFILYLGWASYSCSRHSASSARLLTSP